MIRAEHRAPRDFALERLAPRVRTARTAPGGVIRAERRASRDFALERPAPRERTAHAAVWRVIRAEHRVRSDHLAGKNPVLELGTQG